MADLTLNEKLPPGLRKPWVWINPVGLDEILQRLLDARDYNVPERERENLCSVAHVTITKLRSDAERYRWLRSWQRAGKWKVMKWLSGSGCYGDVKHEADMDSEIDKARKP